MMVPLLKDEEAKNLLNGSGYFPQTPSEKSLKSATGRNPPF